MGYYSPLIELKVYTFWGRMNSATKVVKGRRFRVWGAWKLRYRVRV